MIGTIRIRWKGRGVFKDGKGKIVAGPGDTLTVDHLEAERLMKTGNWETCRGTTWQR